jgi:hypothetical protein
VSIPKKDKIAGFRLTSNLYFGALRGLLKEHKKDLAIPLANNELAKLQEQSNALDRSAVSLNLLN